MVVSPPDHPIWSLVPVQKGKEVVDGVDAGYLAQLEKDAVEKMGLVKFDILGLKNITELKYQFDMIKKLYNVDLSFDDIPLDDQKTWELISEGQTLGMFQFSSKLAISVLDKIKPKNIEELAAANSFIRPGVVGLDEYVETKKDQSKMKKLHPRLDPIFEKTYGAKRLVPNRVNCWKVA
jgi:DNA polymerase-3 subunit alpha